jgi:hypothetical protein
MIFLAGYKMRENGTRIIPGTSDAYRFVKDKRPQVRRFAAAYLNNTCWHCENELVPIGSSRSNGADHRDWNTRHLHKKCWRLLKNDQERFSKSPEDEEEEEEEEEEDSENDGEREVSTERVDREKDKGTSLSPLTLNEAPHSRKRPPEDNPHSSSKKQKTVDTSGNGE